MQKARGKRQEVKNIVYLIAMIKAIGHEQCKYSANS